MASQTLPDATSELDASIPLALQWVGTEGIAVPFCPPSIADARNPILVRADIHVSLTSPRAKGIHMSRLYALLAAQATQPCTQHTVHQLLQHAIHSQNGLAQQARLTLHFDLTLKKPALLSEEHGYQAYPVTLQAQAQADGTVTHSLALTVPYSSTCPCSASLARQLLANAIDRRFSDRTLDRDELIEWVQSAAGTVATPHSQRSFLYLRMACGHAGWPDVHTLLQQLEATLTTPLQTAVKRRDEQAFARLNAENLMFCEDAARRIKAFLERTPSAQDYWFKVEHQESLHAHNAVVIDCKHPHSELGAGDTL